MDLAEGRVYMEIVLPRELFFEILSRQTGVSVAGESQLFPLLLELSKMQREYARLEQALLQVRQTGYGIVMPSTPSRGTSYRDIPLCCRIRE